MLQMPFISEKQLKNLHLQDTSYGVGQWNFSVTNITYNWHLDSPLFQTFYDGRQQSYDIPSLSESSNSSSRDWTLSAANSLFSLPQRNL
jgi:hypothetical protein